MPALPEPRELSFGVADFSGGLNMSRDDRNMPLSESPEAYNIQTADGALRRCGGFSRAHIEGAPLAPLPEPSCRLMLYRTGAQAKEYICAMGKTGFYKAVKSGEGLAWVKISTFPSAAEPTFWVNYNYNETDTLVAGSGSRMLVWENPEAAPSLVEYRPAFARAVIHYERLFGVRDPVYTNRIAFSAQFDPVDYAVMGEGGGYIDLLEEKGKTCDIKSFADALYIFWQYGISRLEAYGYQSEFKAEDCLRLSSELLPDSCQVCGGAILFACRDGVYSFNGYSAARVSDKISALFKQYAFLPGKEASAYYNGCYYLSLAGETPEEDILLEYDLYKNRFRLYKGFAPTQFLTVRTDTERLFFVWQGAVYCLDDSDTFGGLPIPSRWDTPFTDLGRPHALKRFTRLHITLQGKGSVRILLRTEREEKVFLRSLPAKKQVLSLPVNMEGKMVSFRVENVRGNAFYAAGPMLLYTLLP